ncbi:signal peptidase I [Flavobacterium psychrotolerans]|uniref:Signal peptidase I n=1 Tax=Flavobacterium psychrotolerans TaxID=2169410 RepID=A0A2U1JQP3_9FLAO|nr:signal peptidase I [Flavobacterium psychrotolerans]PWA07213.1 signal peptidase I [Flavobacterium psychrotolerans]
MTLLQWFVFFLIVQIIHFLGTWKLYESAGRKRWEAAIPVYNAIILMKIINRPTWWTILLFIPIVNLIMFPVVWVETLRSFGKNTTLDTVLGIATLGIYIYYLNYTQELKYISDRSLIPTNKGADTISSLLFAIVVATLVHTYVMQPYTIPTSSLEKSLLIGDFLFVSKFHYGARTPMTAVALPMVHDTIPLLHSKSYSKWPQLPYFRFPGLQKIERNDIVVFNWPVDTVYKFFDTSKRKADKPIDKKSNYVKRCQGISGDSLQIKDGVVFINGKQLLLPERAKPQYSYTVTTNGSGFDQTYILNELHITDGIYQTAQNTFLFSALTEESAARLKNNPAVTSIVRNISHEAEPGVFPQISNNWNKDNYGPIYIPQAGKTVALNAEILPFYKRIITEYEGNDLKVNGNEIRINGQVATDYTFKQNYYWMMGDNRHNSEDSRYWGYVPENHIVGKPVFIWMSLDSNGKGLGKIRWERMFTTVGGEGQPYSYFKFFLMGLAAYFGITFFMNKKKENS